MIVGIAALAPLGIYFPAIESIAQDFDIFLELVSLTISVYLVFQAVAPSFWGPLADSIWRRPVHIIILLIYIAACVGLALTRIYWLLLAQNGAGQQIERRFCNRSVVGTMNAECRGNVFLPRSGTLGNIASPEERGGFFGLFALGPMMGPILSLVVFWLKIWDGGAWIFWFFTILAAVVIVIVLLFLPETLRSLVGNGSIQRNPTPIDMVLNWLHEITRIPLLHLPNHPLDHAARRTCCSRSCIFSTRTWPSPCFTIRSSTLPFTALRPLFPLFLRTPTVWTSHKLAYATPMAAAGSLDRSSAGRSWTETTEL
ncbi:major facilitator superfamily domain-containing protein [Endogone sp. FLAS-F59071]|nr:major facilitator superfamily domain-containing protein [Endogone sp. FLAS-F59071]|eukprot:RUS20018.1 major facilitator superfamily domain-containing protein [Endogone sp. FLAS-F59071]